jgi:hypothetical protein
MSWARLLKRVFDLDLRHCANCGGELKIIAAIRANCSRGEGIRHMLHPYGEMQTVDPTDTHRTPSQNAPLPHDIPVGVTAHLNASGEVATNGPLTVKNRLGPTATALMGGSDSLSKFACQVIPSSDVMVAGLPLGPTATKRPCPHATSRNVPCSGDVPAVHILKSGEVQIAEPPMATWTSPDHATETNPTEAG